MKRLFLFSTLCCWLLSAKAQTQWVMADTALSTLDADFTFITIDKNNIPYVIFRDAITGGRGTVKKYIGNHWVTVGNAGFSVGEAVGATMTFDNNGTPYVAYTDWANNKNATVMKFDGNNWVIIGTAGFTPHGATYTSIALDSNGVAYIAFRDVYHNYGASVMKYDGINWVYIGTPGFSHPVNDYGGALYTSISIDKNGVLYVAYSDFSNGFKATVQKFDGNDWVYVGIHGFANWNATNTKSMAFDKNGTPYIVCSVTNKATVMKFDGSNWVSIGSSVSQGHTDFASIAMDAKDTIYVAFKDYANGQRATVMKFDGTNWKTIGIAGFTVAPEISYSTLAIDKMGNLYIAYKDGTRNYYGGTLAEHYRAKAMKFINNATDIKETPNNISFSIYPNPANDVFNIHYENNNALGSLQLTVTSIQGKSVYKESINDFNGKLNKLINLSNIAKGTYFVELNSDKAQEIKKIIVE